MDRNDLVANLLGGNSLIHIVIVWNFMDRHFLGGHFLGQMLLQHINNLYEKPKYNAYERFSMVRILLVKDGQAQ